MGGHRRRIGHVGRQLRPALASRRRPCTMPLVAVSCQPRGRRRRRRRRRLLSVGHFIAVRLSTVSSAAVTVRRRPIAVGRCLGTRRRVARRRQRAGAPRRRLCGVHQVGRLETGAPLSCRRRRRRRDGLVLLRSCFTGARSVARRKYASNSSSSRSIVATSQQYSHETLLRLRTVSPK